MPELAQLRNAIAGDALGSLREALLSSAYVSRSTLAGSFRGSRGFAITFTREGRAQLEQRFPFLGQYLELALGDGLARRLLPWPARLGARAAPECNAYYLNLLLVGRSGAVGRHVDATLRAPAQVPDAVPERVSVLYLSVPDGMRGGELRLFRDDRAVARVRPRQGTLLAFRGDLAHEVTEVRCASAEDVRASLVCEQYRLPADAMARLQPVQVQSKAGFQAYLEERKGQPVDRSRMEREK